jgi:Peptidase family M13
MELRIARFTLIALPILALGITAWVCLQPNVHAQTGGDGIDLKGMDITVAPGDDFNAYANGGWMKATPIPADKPTYGIFAMLADDTRKRTVDLIQEAAKGGSSTTGDGRKIGDFYASFMDAAAVESKGLAPLKPQLDAIDAVANRRDLARIPYTRPASNRRTSIRPSSGPARTSSPKRRESSGRRCSMQPG